MVKYYEFDQTDTLKMKLRNLWNLRTFILQYSIEHCSFKNIKTTTTIKPLALPGASSDSCAAGVEGDVVCVGGETSEYSIGISVGECVDLNGVVGNGCD